VKEKVGEGGMGAVFRARDTGLDRDVAVKVLPPALARDEQHRVRFLREARALARVKHPNLVPIYSVAEEQGVYYYAMEFVEGESLRKRLAVAAPMQLEDILRVAGQALSALAAVHAAGITHRDVKSANIMLDASGRAVLMDLGLAKDQAAEAVTTAGMILGTPEYMSPEQAEGEPATPRSDIYSFGVVLYEMATGSVPFRGRSAIAILRKQVDSVPPPVSAARPDLPQEFSDAVAMALEKRPEDRPANASRLASLLLKAGRTPELETLSGSAPPVGLVMAGTAAAARAQSTAHTVIEGAPGIGRTARTIPDSGTGRKRGVAFRPVAALVAGAVVLAIVLGLVYERLTRPKPETKPAPVAERDEVVSEPPVEGPGPGEAAPRANVLDRDGAVLFRNVRVVGATEEGIVVEEKDGSRRTVLYESNPRIEYAHGGERESAAGE
jgi:serine/threonine protein kinase